jgi:hypothetical protein
MKITKTLLCLILVLGAVTGLMALKTNPNGIVGKIDNKAYTYSEYNGILNNYYNYWQSREGKLSAERKKELNDQLWNELIGRAIYDSEIKRRGLVISDSEAHNSVISNPPAQVKQIEALQTNGKFDLEKFKKALEMDAKFRESVYNLVKETMIYDKLFSVLKSKVKAKPDSVKTAWFKDNNTVSGKVIVFDYNKLPDMDVSDEEISSYYYANRENYKKNPARRYYYVKFGGEKYTKVKADSIYNAIRQGADFAALAIEHSQDPGSGQQGGDLGWFTRGRMVKPFEDTAFALADSAVSEPVKSQFGWHIIQTLGRRTNEQGQEEVHARHILIKSDLDDKAKAQIEKEATAFAETARETGLQMAAARLGYTVSETPEFYEQDRSVPEIGQFPELIKEAFTNSVGYIPGKVTAPTGEAFICEISDSLGSHYSPLEKESPNVKSVVGRNKKIAANREQASLFFEQHKGEDYIAIAERDSLHIVDVNNIKADSSIPGIGNVKALNDSLLAHSAGEFTGLIEHDSKLYIGKVTDRKKATQSEWDKQKNSVLAKANEDLKNNHLNNWYFQQRQKIKIEDNRKDYFELPAPRGAQQIKLQ